MPNPSPFAQPWMLATGAILTVMTRRVPRHDCLGGAPKSPESQKTTRAILANSWGIEDRQKLLETLSWLRDAGHRAERDPSAQDGLDERGLLAWDLVRLVAVTGWGYLADFISEDEAWGFIDPAARQLQQAYRSWDDLGRAYVAGTSWWKEEAGPDCQGIANGLLSNPASPWRVIPWNMDLDLNVDPSNLRGAARPGTSYAIYLVAMVVAIAGVGGIVWKVLGSAARDVKGALSEVRKASASAPAAPAPTPPPAVKAAAAAWDGKTPLRCQGSMVLVVEGVTARSDGEPPVTAAGNCQLTLKNVSLQGPVALSVAGNAQVTVVGGSLTGKTAAVSALANARVTLSGTRLAGPVQRLGSAQVTGP